MRTDGHVNRTANSRAFVRARGYCVAITPTPAANFLADIRLFALTFAGGFLFMTVYLA